MNRPSMIQVLAMVVAMATLGRFGGAAAQSGSPEPRSAEEDDWEVPRTIHGHPDLQGNWTNVTLTPLQREEGRGPVYTPQEVAAIEDPRDDVCPPSPGTADCGRDVAEISDDSSLSDEALLSGREYNEVYWDRGTRVARVDGEPRTSLITRPETGRIPPLSAQGRERVEARREFEEQFGEYDHPELRSLAERCIVSFGSSAGPPILPNSAYNNNYTIVQTEEHVMILAEMVHDARIIHLRDSEPGPDETGPLPEHIRPWFGHSEGWWEGDTLVVETTHIHPEQTYRGVPPSAERTVTERFTRADAQTILYEFTVDDPGTYTEPWGGQIPMKRQEQRLYEYACHEGNYSLPGVLSGARYQESMDPEDGDRE